MKKALLLTITAGMTFGAFAQSSTKLAMSSAKMNEVRSVLSSTPTVHAKTTAVGDTTLLYYVNVFSSPYDTILAYSVGTNHDSGYVAGTDAYGDKAYAQRYDFNDTLATLQVLGVYAMFHGTVQTTSTKNVTFNVWPVAARSAVSGVTNWYYSGLPNSASALATQSVSVTNLGIGMAGATDSLRSHYFTTPTSYLHSSFFVGASFSYDFTALAGDTLGLYTSKSGTRAASSAAYLSGTDTIINSRCVTMYSDNTWHDNYLENFQLASDFVMGPIVKIGKPVGVAHVTRNTLSFYGNYPNPANDVTNIKVALANSTDVTVIVTDMAGRTVNTIQQNGLTAGEHIIPVNVSNLAAGTYVYIVRTATGDAIGSQFTVAK